MQESYGAIPFIVGRTLLAAIFLVGPLVNLIPNFSAVSVAMHATGIPASEVVLAGAIAFLLAGSLSLILGYRARTGALLLIVFLVPATLLFHAPWQAADQAIHFLKNAGLAGALLLVVAAGPGAGSLDGRKP